MLTGPPTGCFGHTQYMSAAVIGIILVIISAAIEALSNVLQHKATNSVTDAANETSAVLRTLKKPLFILGFALMVVGYAFHVVSLGLGELAVIQVIFVSQLVFILPFARLISKTHITAKDWIGALIVTAGIALFVTFAKPTEGTKTAPGSKWIIAILATAIVIAILVTVAYRFVSGPRALLLGASGGVMNGLVAPLTKETIGVVDQGMGALFGGWQLWVTLLAAILGVLFPLLAFRAGPITASFPAVMSLNPIVATFLGVYLFGESLQTGFVPILMMLVSAVLILTGIVWLSRSKAVRDSFEDSSAAEAAGISN